MDIESQSSDAHAGGVAGPPPFSCTRIDSGSGAAWIRVVGELDLATSPQLERALAEAATHGQLITVLDLRSLDFVDVTGVHLVVDATARARREGRRLITLRGSARVDLLFTLTATTDRVEFFDLHAAEPPLREPLAAYIDATATP